LTHGVGAKVASRLTPFFLQRYQKENAMKPEEKSCMQYLGELLSIMKASNQYEQTLHLIVDRIVRMFDCQTCAVVLIDPKTEYLNIENSIGLSYTFCKEFRRKLATGAIGEVLWTGKPVLITSYDDEPTKAAELQLENRFESCVCVQIAVDQRTVGYLHVDSVMPRAFTGDDVHTFQTFADLAGVAINKARLHEENLRLDTIDRDTGMEKYSSFVQKLQVVMERAIRFDEQFALLLLDVDNFKLILGTHGHDAAIKFLGELGAVVRADLRAIDASGRYGFDEFIVMLANTDLEKAVDFAQTICRKIESTPFVGNTIQTTVSIGVAAYPQNGKTKDDLILTAKQALFEAQRAGRNNVFFYPAEWFSSESVMH
jgi:diguanylate cyclase (GGDEF)-like protein